MVCIKIKKGKLKEKNKEHLESFLENFTDNQIKQQKIIELAQEQKFDEITKISQNKLEISTINKDKSFHYIPYDFRQSSFEKDILEQFFTLNYKDLEIYYNGERGLSEFVIECYKKTKNSYRYIGRYATDFLIVQREDNKIKKILILENNNTQDLKKIIDNEFNYIATSYTYNYTLKIKIIP